MDELLGCVGPPRQQFAKLHDSAGHAISFLGVVEKNLTEGGTMAVRNGSFCPL
jgi:hypothetical protein